VPVAVFSASTTPVPAAVESPEYSSTLAPMSALPVVVTVTVGRVPPPAVIGALQTLSSVCSLAAWFAIKRTMGLRVSAEHERVGLDLSEMGMEAYPADALGDAVTEADRPPPAGTREPTA